MSPLTCNMIFQLHGTTSLASCPLTTVVPIVVYSEGVMSYLAVPGILGGVLREVSVGGAPPNNIVGWKRLWVRRVFCKTLATDTYVTDTVHAR